jgi:hypothetical protein
VEVVPEERCVRGEIASPKLLYDLFVGLTLGQAAMMWDDQTAGNMLCHRAGENVAQKYYTNGVADYDLVKIRYGEIEQGDAVALKVRRSSSDVNMSRPIPSQRSKALALYSTPAVRALSRRIATGQVSSEIPEVQPVGKPMTLNGRLTETREDKTKLEEEAMVSYLVRSGSEFVLIPDYQGYAEVKLALQEALECYQDLQRYTDDLGTEPRKKGTRQWTYIMELKTDQSLPSDSEERGLPEGWGQKEKLKEVQCFYSKIFSSSSPALAAWRTLWHGLDGISQCQEKTDEEPPSERPPGGG